MSTTPRTDAAAVFDCDGHDVLHECGTHVPADFARELERENAALREQLATTERLRFGADADRRQQRHELDQLRADKARLDWLERPQQIAEYANPFRDVVHRINSGLTLRAAIDAAMNKAQQ